MTAAKLYDRENEMHVVPNADLISHDLTTDCVCGPEVEHIEHGYVVKHHSLDGRELREPDYAG